MNKPIIVERFADNGSHSHYALIDRDTGELLWSEAVEEEIQRVKNPNVVGQSEQYHCELYDFGRKDKPCDKQCDGCKAMNLD